MKDISFTAQPTQGSPDNRRLLEAGDAELGFQSGDSLAQAVSSKEAGIDKLRGVAALYPGYIQILARSRSPRGSEGQALLGRTGKIGPDGHCHRPSQGGRLDLRRSRQGRLRGFAEGGRMVEEGTLDADFLAWADWALSLFGMFLPRARRRSCRSRPKWSRRSAPLTSPEPFPRALMTGSPRRSRPAVIMTLLVTREGVSDDLVYLMTKSLFDHLDLLAQTHPASQGYRCRQGAVRFAGPAPSRRGTVLPRNRPGEVTMGLIPPTSLKSLVIGCNCDRGRIPDIAPI